MREGGERMAAAASTATATEGMVVPWRRVEGKVVMVTGASSGIGHDLCLDLAAAGCLVVAAARRVDRLRSLCDEIHRYLPSSSSSPVPVAEVRVVAVELDISAGSAAVAASVEKAWAAFGRIDALVNNAGLRGAIHPALAWEEEEWKEQMATNSDGSWHVTRHVCIRMRDAKQNGSVINIASIAGLSRGQLPGGLPYGVSKSAVNSMTRILALELGEYGIRVNSISPGLFKSEITEGLMKKEWLKTVTERIIPMRENGSSDPALTSLVRYLIHDSSQYVSGNEFIVDCGATIPGVPIFSSL